MAETTEPQDRLRVEDDPAHHRFVAYIGDEVAGHVTYSRQSQAVVLIHTTVGDAYAGRGVGGALARGALGQVRSAGLPVVVRCPFIAAWIEKHPEYRELDRAADREE